jgi:ATP-binding protein involved in chromosome partitioning
MRTSDDDKNAALTAALWLAFSFLCPSCGQQTDIFGHGGAWREAERLGVEFLGEIPLDVAIRTTSDDGQPIVASQPNSPHAVVYRSIAARVW